MGQENPSSGKAECVTVSIHSIYDEDGKFGGSNDFSDFDVTFHRIDWSGKTIRHSAWLRLFLPPSLHKYITKRRE